MVPLGGSSEPINDIGTRQKTDYDIVAKSSESRLNDIGVRRLRRKKIKNMSSEPS